MSYIKNFGEFRESNKYANSKISLSELSELIKEIQDSNYRINEENIFKGWGDKIKGVLGNFGKFFSDGQMAILKKILPKKKFSLTPDQLKWVYDYVVKCEGEFTINNFLKVFSKLLKSKGGQKEVREAVSLPAEVATVASKLPTKLPPLPPVPKIPNLLTDMTPDSGDVSGVAKDVGEIGASHPEYILFAAVLGLLIFGGFKIINFLKNKDKKINLSDLPTKTPSQPDEKPESPNKKPSQPDERLESPTKRPNQPDERLETPTKKGAQPVEKGSETPTKKAAQPDEKPEASTQDLKNKFAEVINSFRTYKPDLSEPSTGWWYSEEVESLDNDNFGWKAYPPTVKPDWISSERWIEILKDFQAGGAQVPKEFEERGFKFLTPSDKNDIKYDEEKNRMLFQNPASTYKAPGKEPKFLK